MTDIEKLQVSVAKWRLRDQPFAVRCGRFVLLDAASKAVVTADLPRVCGCKTFARARAEADNIIADELARIARASAIAQSTANRGVKTK